MAEATRSVNHNAKKRSATSQSIRNNLKNIIMKSIIIRCDSFSVARDIDSELDDSKQQYLFIGKTNDGKYSIVIKNADEKYINALQMCFFSDIKIEDL